MRDSFGKRTGVIKHVMELGTHLFCEICKLLSLHFRSLVAGAAFILILMP